MNTQLLERCEIAAPADPEPADLVNEGRRELADEAARILGYTTLKESLQRAAEQAQQESVEARLSRVLRERDVRPFTRESVEAYKKETRRWNWLANFLDAESSRSSSGQEEAGWVALAGLMLVIGIVAGIVALVAWPFGGYSVMYPASAISGVILGGFLAVFCAFSAIQAWFGSIRRVRWELTPIDNYEEPIPDFALQTALEIKREVPEAEFLVDVCKREEITVDPFLVVRAGEAEHHIEVWNEPGFTAERSA